MSRHLLIAIALLSPQAAIGEAPPVSLAGPEVYKLDWNTRAMIGHDLDGDKRIDLLLLNNDRARIDILYQRKPGKRKSGKLNPGKSGVWEPVLEDTRFDKSSVVTGGSMYALGAGDLDGDGRPDLVFTGKPDPLTVLYQGRDGDWSRKRVIEIDQPATWASSLIVADLNADGRDDVVILGKSEMLVLRQNRDGELEGPSRYPMADQDGYGLVARDLDGNRQLDLMYLVPKSKGAWRARFQDKRGEFGPERVFRIESPATVLSPLQGAKAESPVFAAVRRRTKLVELLSLSQAEGEPEAAVELHPRIFSIAAGGTQEPSYSVGDFDGDQQIDLAVANERSADVRIYIQKKSGGFERTSYPSLPEAQSIASGDVDGDGRDELFVVSASEGTVGMSRLSVEGRMSYPRPLPTAGRPLAVVAGRLGGEAELQVGYLFEEDGARGLIILDPVGGGESWNERRIELDGLRTDPSALRIVDANGDGRSDLAVFIVQSPMRLLLQNDQGGFDEATAATGFRPGLVDDLRASALTLGDVNGDGRAEMLVAGEGFARSLEITETGELSVVDQFNARNPGDQVETAVVIDLDDDGVAEILLAVEDEDALQLLKRDDQGVYRYRESLPVGSIELIGTEVIDLDRDGHQDLLFWGEDRFWWIPVGKPGLAVETLASYESELDEMFPSRLAVGDLNNDGRQEIVVIDAVESRVMEILISDDDRSWNSALRFTVFESDPHYQGRTGAAREPREVLIADLTADGKADLVLLVHDRVLIYPQR